jgi:hypothetical protein
MVIGKCEMLRDDSAQDLANIVQNSTHQLRPLTLAVDLELKLVWSVDGICFSSLVVAIPADDADAAQTILPAALDQRARERMISDSTGRDRVGARISYTNKAGVYVAHYGLKIRCGSEVERSTCCIWLGGKIALALV